MNAARLIRLKENGFVWNWLPMLGWMAIIFIASHQPADDLPHFGLWDFLVKKTAHFVIYTVLALLVYRVTEASQRPYLYAFLITVLYAVSDEYHQTFIPGRDGNIIDVLIDSAGAAIALYLHSRWQNNVTFNR